MYGIHAETSSPVVVLAVFPGRLDVALEPEDLRRLPDLHDQHHRHEGGDGGQDDRHLRSDGVGHQDQHAREGDLEQAAMGGSTSAARLAPDMMTTM